MEINEKTFPPSQEQDRDDHSFHTDSTVLEVLARERRQVKEIKEIQMGNEKSTYPYLLIIDMVLGIKTRKTPPENFYIWSMHLEVLRYKII